MVNKVGALRSRTLGFWTIVCLAVGGTIGTWIVDMTYWFQLSGAGCLWGLLLAGACVMPLALCYSELNSMLPFAGGEPIWTTNAFGWFFGWLQGWALILLYVLALTWVIYGLGTIAIYAFPDLSFSTIRLIGVVLLLIWLVMSVFKVEIGGMTAMVMVWAMIAGAVITWVFFFSSGEWHYSNLTPWFPQGAAGFGVVAGIMLFKFVGFDLVPQFAEEAKYPLKKVWKVYLAVMLLTTGIYGMAIIANGGMWSWERIAGATMIDPVIAAELGLYAIAWVIVVAAILTVITVMPGFWAAASRVLYGMARQRQMPPALAKTNRFGQPWIANIIVGVFAVYFAYFSPEAWVEYIYTIFSLTAGIVFLLVALSFITLRIRQPEWKRPYKAPRWIVLGSIAAAYCVWVIYTASSEITAEGVYALIGFYVVGAIFVVYVWYKRKREPEKYKLHTLTPKDISAEVRERM